MTRSIAALPNLTTSCHCPPLLSPKPLFVLPTAKMFRTVPRMAGYVNSITLQLHLSPNGRARARPKSVSQSGFSSRLRLSFAIAIDTAPEIAFYFGIDNAY